MFSAGRKLLLQRVPRTRPLLRPASTSIFTSFLHKLLWEKTDNELLSLQDNLKQSGDKQLAKQQLQRLLSDGKATAVHCKWALEHVSTGEKFDHALLNAMKDKNIPTDEEARALVEANRRRPWSSDESRALMESMKQNGIMPDVSDFTQLISNLLHDGDLVAAQHVYDVEMPASGIEPNNGTKVTMAQADKLARR